LKVPIMNIKFPDQLGIQTVSDVKAELESAIAADGAIVLDVSEVESVDAAALQLLVAFVQHAALKKREFEWFEPTDVFLKTVDLMGLKAAMSV